VNRPSDNSGGVLLLRSGPVAGEDLQLRVSIGGGDPRVSDLAFHGRHPYRNLGLTECCVMLIW
jgi:hypothetical protein